MAWLRWEEQYSPQMPEAEKQAAIQELVNKIIANDPPWIRIALKAWLLDVCNIVEVERNEIDPSGIFLDPRVRFETKKRIHEGLALMECIRNFRLARTEFEDAYIEMWHPE